MVIRAWPPHPLAVSVERGVCVDCLTSDLYSSTERRSFVTQAALRRPAPSPSAPATVNRELRQTRSADRSTSPTFPSAANPGDGRSEPLEHAEPVEQATPTRSSFSRSASARQPGKDRLIVEGIPRDSGPLSTIG